MLPALGSNIPRLRLVNTDAAISSLTEPRSESAEKLKSLVLFVKSVVILEMTQYLFIYLLIHLINV